MRRGMIRYYLNIDGDAPYDYGTSRDETGSLFLLDHGAYERAPRILPEHEKDLIAGDREIARLPFSCVTRPGRLCRSQGANRRSPAGRAQ
jgi:hypothetical protein